MEWSARVGQTGVRYVCRWEGRGLSWCNACVCSVVPCADSVFVFITYFDIPAILICARLVDHCDKTGVPYAFTDDLFAAFNYTFDPEAFESTWRCLFHASVNAWFSTSLPLPPP